VRINDAIKPSNNFRFQSQDPSQDLKVTLVVAVENHNVIARDSFCETSQVTDIEQ